MGWRVVVIENSAKLDLRLGFLVVRNLETTTRIFIDEISVLIIESVQCSITTALLAELVKQKVEVIFCDKAKNPSSELLAYYGNYDTAIKIRKQIAWSEDIKKKAWEKIVKLKIQKQSEVIKDISPQRHAQLLEYAEQVHDGDSSNREGHAAKVYFNTLFGLKFTRQQQTPINFALNYGYSVLLGIINREIVTNGYITQIGISHDNMFNCFNLGSDLMEPFRPVIDREVKRVIPTKFESKEKQQILEIFNKEILIDNKNQTIINAISIYVRSVFQFLENEKDATIKDYDWV